MFADPLVVGISAQASLNRVSVGDSSSTFLSSDETLSAKISHQLTKGRRRRMIRLDQTKIAADPLTALNASVKAGVYIVIDEPSFGFSDQDLIDLVTMLMETLKGASLAAANLTVDCTDANLQKLLNGES